MDLVAVPAHRAHRGGEDRALSAAWEREGGIIRHLPVAVAVLLAGLLFWAPLPFASVTPLGESFLSAATAVLLAAAVLVSPDLSGLRRLALPAACAIALGLLGLLQAAPWPPAWVAAVSPAHAEVAAGARAVLSPATDVPLPVPRLSLAPGVTLRTAIDFFAVAAALAVGALVGRRRRHRRIVGAAIVAAAGFEVLFGARRWVVRAATIWGRPVPGDVRRLRGTFVNPNHLAVYLEIALALTLAWVFWALRRARHEPGLERRLVLVGPPLLTWATLFAGLAFTGSRAGLVATLVAAVAQGAAMAWGRRRLGYAALGAVAGAVGLTVVAAIGFQEGLGRLLSTSGSDLSWESRKLGMAATLDIWHRFPWIGSGLGTFREAFPAFQPQGVTGTWTHAHNDWLEILATAGWVGGAALLVGLVGLLLRLARAVASGRRSEDRAAAVAALGALVAVGLHEAVDFGLTMPANAVTLAVVVGAAAAVRLRDEASPGRGAADRR